MSKVIIGLCGRMGSGKDTVGQMLLDVLPNSTRMAFGDSLKMEIAEVLAEKVKSYDRLTSIDKNYFFKLFNTVGKKERFRALYQIWGTEFRRGYCSESYWTNKLREEIFASDSDIIIVTDCRFPDEVELIRELGGTVIKVERKRKLKDRILSLFKKEHISESNTDKLKADHVIVNNSTIAQLELLVNDLIRILKLNDK